METSVIAERDNSKNKIEVEAGRYTIKNTKEWQRRFFLTDINIQIMFSMKSDSELTVIYIYVYIHKYNNQLK